MEEGNKKSSQKKEKKMKRKKKESTGELTSSKTKKKRTKTSKRTDDEIQEEKHKKIQDPTKKEKRKRSDGKKESKSSKKKRTKNEGIEGTLPVPNTVIEKIKSEGTNEEAKKKVNREETRHIGSWSPFSKLSKAISSRSSDNKDIIHSIHTDSPKNLQGRLKKDLSSSTIPGELSVQPLPGLSKIRTHHGRKTFPHITDIPNPVTCSVIPTNSFLEMEKLKYPVFIDFSPSHYEITCSKPLDYLPDIIKEYVHLLCSFPPSLCTNITRINFNDNKLTEFKHVRHLRRIKRLFLDNNSLSYLDVSCLQQLIVLSVVNNHFESFTSCKLPTSLVHLNASHNIMKGPFWEIEKLQDLQFLDVSHCGLSYTDEEFVAEIVTPLQQLPRLSHLLLLDNPSFDEYSNLNHTVLDKLSLLHFYNGKEAELQRKLKFYSKVVQKRDTREETRLAKTKIRKDASRNNALVPPTFECSTLPESILELLFDRLSFSDLLAASSVCKRWRFLCVERIKLHQNISTSIHILIGTSDSIIDSYVAEISKYFPTIPCRISSIANFSKDVLVRDRFLLVLFNDTDDEFHDPWADLYEKLSFLFVSRCSGKEPMEMLFPFASYAIFKPPHVYDTSVDGIDHLLQYTGCKKLFNHSQENIEPAPFSGWLQDVSTVISPTDRT